MRKFLLIFVVLATLVQVVLLVRRFRAEEQLVTTRESVKRLATLTMETFHGQDPPQGAAFWQAIGRTEPILDIWGQEFHMEVFAGESHKEYLWISAGPDGKRGTSDDIKARVPYQKGSTLDLTHPGNSSDFGLSSSDAK